jgi:hypothetical protein
MGGIMKKQLLVIGLVTGLLVGLGTTAAQEASAEHQLSVEIPALLVIRFVPTFGGTVTVADPVVFRPAAEAIADGITSFSVVDPAVMNWADIEIYANTRELGFKILVATTNAEFEWSNVSVTPSENDLNISTFNLPEDGSEQIYASSAPGSTDGWVSLGISPASYTLTLSGSEEEGIYETTVIYTIADL